MLTGYTYYQQINLTGETGAGTGYVVTLRVGESSGSSGADFNLNAHCQSFPNDIRFTASDGTTLLPATTIYTSGASPNRTIVVKVLVSADLSSNQSIYCFYGNSTALAAWNFADTFPVLPGDNFNAYHDWHAQNVVFGAESLDVGGPMAWYNASVNKTFIVMFGYDQNPYAIYFDHATKEWSAQVQVGTNPLSIPDAYGTPITLQASDGTFHVFFGCHSSQLQYARSNNPNDISAWTDMTSSLPAGTDKVSFASPVEDSSGNIYVFFKYAVTTSPETLADMRFMKSSDGGSTWSTPVSIVEAVIPSGGDRCWIWPSGNLQVVGNKICFGFEYYTNYVAPTEYIYGPYCAYLNTNDDHLYAQDGTDLGTQIVRADADAHCCPIGTSVTYVRSCRVRMDASGNMYLVYSYNEVQWFVYWNGTAWTTPLEITAVTNVNDVADIDFISDTEIYVALSNGTDAQVWQWDGSSWSLLDTMANLATYGLSLLNPLWVKNHNSDVKVTFSQQNTGNLNHTFAWGDQGLVGNYLGYDSDADLQSAWNGGTRAARNFTTVFEGLASLFTNGSGSNPSRTFVKPSDLMIVEGAGLFSVAGDNFYIILQDPGVAAVATIMGGYPTSGHWGYVTAGTYTDSGVANAPNTWYWWRLIVDFTAQTFTFEVSTDGTTWTTVANAVALQAAASTASYLGLGQYNSYHDIVSLRKYVSPEPAFSSSGGETTSNTSTQAVTAISQLYATGNGSINSLGGDTSSDLRGFVFGTTSHGDPGNVAPGASGYDTYFEESGTFAIGAFADYLTSLLPGTTYYVRAYSHISTGYSYGNEVSFSTVAATLEVLTYDANNILSNQAAGNGYAVSGLDDIDQVGFDWGLVSGGPYPDSVELAAAFSGAFQLDLTALTDSTLYYFRAKAHSASLGWVYGSELSFTTSAALPVVQTDPPAAISTTTATWQGEITDEGGGGIDARGFVYGTTSLADPSSSTDPSLTGYDAYTSQEGAFGVGTFTQAVTGLTVSQMYFVRVWVHNAFGYAYGKEVEVVTNYNVNILLPTGVAGVGIRFDSGPGDGYPNAYAGHNSHAVMVSLKDTQYSSPSASGTTWGVLTGNYVYEVFYYNANFYRDFYLFTLPYRRDDSVVKIKWKAAVYKNAYPYGQYRRSLHTNGEIYDGTTEDIVLGSPDVCEVLYTNPYTGLPWSIADLDAIWAGIWLGNEGSFGIAACDFLSLYVLWANAAVTVGGVTSAGGTNRVLYGTVVEDEGETCNVHFEWGATTAYGNTTTDQVKAKGQSFSETIDIGALTTIHYRAVITTACGETFYSADGLYPVPTPGTTGYVPARGTMPHRLSQGGAI